MSRIFWGKQVERCTPHPGVMPQYLPLSNSRSLQRMSIDFQLANASDSGGEECANSPDSRVSITQWK